MRSASEGASRGPARLSAAAAAMDYLPVFLRLDGHPVVVVGGGTVALRKAAWLRRAGARVTVVAPGVHAELDRKSTRLNSSHVEISYAVFCLKKKRSRDVLIVIGKQTV